MKHLFQTLTVTSLFAGLLFYSCENCQPIINTVHDPKVNQPPVANTGADTDVVVPR